MEYQLKPVENPILPIFPMKTQCTPSKQRSTSCFAPSAPFLGAPTPYHLEPQQLRRSVGPTSTRPTPSALKSTPLRAIYRYILYNGRIPRPSIRKNNRPEHFLCGFTLTSRIPVGIYAQCPGLCAHSCHSTLHACEFRTTSIKSIGMSIYFCDFEVPGILLFVRILYTYFSHIYQKLHYSRTTKSYYKHTPKSQYIISFLFVLKSIYTRPCR